MRIGELAERAGVNAKTIRYYESIGLMQPPERTSSNYRDYPEDAAERLRFIRDSQSAGLTLAEIGSILDMKSEGRSTCAHTRDLLHRHLDEIDDQIEALKAARAELEVLARRADSLDPGACTDPHRCQVIAAASTAHDPGSRTRLTLADHH
ncbi:MAG: heavy metal-responsive transcriptional regulator [Demequinaceae bacterium]|nr:heavy metal-responsive transcriptional regulator [Demequinaceae bacterium]